MKVLWVLKKNTGMSDNFQDFTGEDVKVAMQVSTFSEVHEPHSTEEE